MHLHLSELDLVEKALDDIETCEACLRAMLGERFGANPKCRACTGRVLFGLAQRQQRANSKPPPPPTVDFSFVPAHQDAMHGRLLNWGRSCNGGVGDDSAPMWRQTQSANTWHSGYGQDTIVPVNRSDASVIGTAVYFLPEPHMQSLQWYYVKRTSVMQGRKLVNYCSAEALARYVIDARQMLINRGV